MSSQTQQQDSTGGDSPPSRSGQPSAEQLVVGLPHLGLVHSKLVYLGIGYKEIETSTDLGLALLSLDDVDAAGALLLKHGRAAGQRGGSRAEPPTSLEQVLWGLRQSFAAAYAGWTPVLGKNRLVGRVHGVGEISYGGTGEPEQAKAASGLPPRAAGPGRGVRIGVLDTRLYPQPWLAGGWAARYSDTLTDFSQTLTAEGHATFVTGLILRQAPGATVEVRGVLDEDGTAYSWDVAKAMVEFGRSGLDILNLSFSCYTEDGEPPLVLSAAVDRLPQDVVVVAAAGNHGSPKDADGTPRSDDARRRPSWPAALDDVIAVGAVDAHGRRAAFSPDAPWIDLLAPGVDLTSTYLPQARSAAQAYPVQYDGFARWSGTSFSAALVTGLIAAGAEPGRMPARGALLNILGARHSRVAQDVLHSSAPYLDLAGF